MELNSESSLQLSIDGVDNLDQILKFSSLEIFIYGMRGVKIYN
jgi:hypothetical protein